MKLYLLSGDKKNNVKNVKNPLSQRAEAKNAKVKPNNVLALARNLYYISVRNVEKLSSIASAIDSPTGSTESEKLFVSRNCPGVLRV